MDIEAKAIVTVLGRDRKGIIAGVSRVLYEHNVNILDIAQTVLERGTCLRRNVGAILVKNDVIISTGYAGAPRGRANCTDLGVCRRAALNIPRGQRYELCRSVHAEANCIIAASREEMLGSTLYLAMTDAQTGALWPWDARLDDNAGSAFAPERDGRSVYLVGGFTASDSTPRRRAGRFSTTSGAAFSWDPELNAHATAVAVSLREQMRQRGYDVRGSESTLPGGENGKAPGELARRISMVLCAILLQDIGGGQCPDAAGHLPLLRS